jgi:hypothetical protein
LNVLAGRRAFRRSGLSRRSEQTADVEAARHGDDAADHAAEGDQEPNVWALERAHCGSLGPAPMQLGEVVFGGHEVTSDVVDRR